MKKLVGPIVRFSVSALLIAYVCTLIQFRDLPISTFALAGGGSVTGVVLSRDDLAVTVRPPGKKPQTLAVARIAGETAAGVQPGFGSILSGLDLNVYFPYSLLWFVPFLLSVERWRVLMRVQGLRIGYFDALRLTYIGIFLSNVLPGVTGGDVGKAVLLAPSTARKTRMVTAIFADRVIGLIALALVAAAAILTHLSQPVFHDPAKVVVLFLGGVAAFFLFYFNPWLRRTRLFAWMRDEMPGHGILREFDAAAHDLRGAPGAVVKTLLLSLAGHSAQLLAGYGFGQALGIKEARLEHYFSFVPLIAIAAALPLSISGWGVAEGGYAWLFGTVNVPETSSVTLSILGRLTTIVYSLGGGLCLMFNKPRYDVQETTPTAPDAPVAEAAGATPLPAIGTPGGAGGAPTASA
ncbi:MAG: flippase-like domain-containing protein [Planctomycetes bacterium]|nr:flippase-like domain-containing protein [Planctomycetota bacterium]